MLHGSERAEQLFLGEAEALSRLAHPNIVHFFGLFQREGQLAIVMEFVRGRPLSEVIADAVKLRGKPNLPADPDVTSVEYLLSTFGCACRYSRPFP